MDGAGAASGWMESTCQTFGIGAGAETTKRKFSLHPEICIRYIQPAKPCHHHSRGIFSSIVWCAVSYLATRCRIASLRPLWDQLYSIIALRAPRLIEFALDHSPMAGQRDDHGHLQFQHTQLGVYLVGVCALLYAVGERGQVRSKWRKTPLDASYHSICMLAKQLQNESVLVACNRCPWHERNQPQFAPVVVDNWAQALGSGAVRASLHQAAQRSAATQTPHMFGMHIYAARSPAARGGSFQSGGQLASVAPQSRSPCPISTAPRASLPAFPRFAVFDGYKGSRMAKARMWALK